MRKEDFVRPDCRGMERQAFRRLLHLQKHGGRAPPSARRRRSILPTIPTTASCAATAPATPITTSTSATRCLDPWPCAWAPSCPFQTTYYLNGHHFIDCELHRRGVHFRKDDNAFLWVADPKALQAAADRAQRQDHPQTPGLLDVGRRAEVLQEGPRTPSTWAATTRSTS